MPMKNPPHPGRTIANACLEPLGLTVTAGARVLGVARPTLSNAIDGPTRSTAQRDRRPNAIDGKAAISPEMAIRLEKAFGSTANAWLRMQAAYDLAQARKREKRIKVKRVVAA